MLMKCNQMGCSSIATHRVFWPGREPLPTCWFHVQIAIGIANSMGLYVHAEEMPYDASREGENSSQNPEGEVH